MYLNGGKLLEYPLKGKLAGNWQMDRIMIILGKYDPMASSAPTLGLYTIIFKHGYWYI